jgi:hypothetical protein
MAARSVHQHTRLMSAWILATLVSGLLACVPEDESGLAGVDTLSESRTKPRTLPGKVGTEPSTAPSSHSAASPVPGATATPNQGVNIGAGIVDASKPDPTETLPPANAPAATPTPFGTTGDEVGFKGPALGLAALTSQPFPLVLTSSGIQVIGANGLAGQRLADPITSPVAIAGENNRTAWIASTDPPHLDSITLGSAEFAFSASAPLPAPPQTLAARDGEVWVVLRTGSLFRLRTSDLATASFGGFNQATAIALDATRAWVTNRTGTLFEVQRTNGAVIATTSIGLEASDLAVDPQGTVWVTHSNQGIATRISGPSVTTIALGATASALVTDSRRVWFGVRGAIKTVTLDGVLETPDPALRFDPIDLCLDGSGRVWALDRMGQVQWIWPRKAGE